MKWVASALVCRPRCCKKEGDETRGFVALSNEISGCDLGSAERTAVFYARFRRARRAIIPRPVAIRSRLAGSGTTSIFPGPPVTPSRTNHSSNPSFSMYAPLGRPNCE